MQAKHSIYNKFPLEPGGHEIRLLRFTPGSWSAHLSCKILTVPLSGDVPEYHAISYVWGDKSALQVICINGISFSITSNLFNALRRLRAHYQDTILLWADAICIDQSSILERNEQVSMMGVIYSTAKQVLVWMGELDMECWYRDGGSHSRLQNCYNFSGDGHDYVEHANDYSPMFVSNGSAESQDSRLQVRPTAWADDGPLMSLHIAWLFRILADQRHLIEIPPFCLDPSGETQTYLERFYHGIRYLAENPYFRRLWVVQETVLAKSIRVLFGTASLPWAVLVAGMYNFWDHTPARCCLSSGYKHYELRITIRGILQQFASLDELARRCMVGALGGQGDTDGHSPALFDLCLELLSRQTTEDVDRIYALLGMQRHTTENHIVPQYENNTASVFFDTICKHISASGSLSSLTFGGVRNRYADLPSWAIDFTAFETSAEIMETWLCVGPLYRLWTTSLSEPCCYSIVATELDVDALLIDRVHTVSPVISIAFWSQFTDWKQDVLARCRPDKEYGNGCEWSEAWLRTLCADCCWGSNSARRITVRDLELLSTKWPMLGLQSRTPDHDSSADQAFSNSESDALNQEHDATTKNSMFKLETGEYVPLDAHYNDILRMMYAMILGQRVFLTHAGLLGVANENISDGDQLVMVRGTPTPLILRACQTAAPYPKQPTFTLIGCTYVHGIMDKSFDELVNIYGGRIETVRLV